MLLTFSALMSIIRIIPAGVAELADVLDLGSSGVNRASSSLVARTRRREFEHKKTGAPLFQEGGGRGAQILKIEAEKAQKKPGGYKLPAGLFSWI